MASKAKKPTAAVTVDSDLVAVVVPAVPVAVPVADPVAAEAARLSIAPLVAAFERAFDYCSVSYFGGLLLPPVITIAQGAKARANGWVSVGQVWHEIAGKQTAHELNIASEYLDRPFADVVTTLMHEMVHLENLRNGIQDCARGGSRHNKKFAECADAHGMEGFKGDDFSRVGFRARLSDATAAALIPELEFLKQAITISRDENGQKVKTKKAGVIKYTCPVCEASCRATKEIAILCMDCDQPMVQE